MSPLVLKSLNSEFSPTQKPKTLVERKRRENNQRGQWMRGERLTRAEDKLFEEALVIFGEEEDSVLL